MHPEALILRRCYPVPVTFADLLAAACFVGIRPWPSTRRAERIVGNVYARVAGVGRAKWSAALKQVTGALDEVYAVVDGREVRVALVDARPDGAAVDARADGAAGVRDGDVNGVRHEYINHLLYTADREGYWERPHEVRLDLSPRPVSHSEVARAVVVGQECVERHGNR